MGTFLAPWTCTSAASSGLLPCVPSCLCASSPVSSLRQADGAEPTRPDPPLCQALCGLGHGPQRPGEGAGVMPTGRAASTGRRKDSMMTPVLMDVGVGSHVGMWLDRNLCVGWQGHRVRHTAWHGLLWAWAAGLSQLTPSHQHPRQLCIVRQTSSVAGYGSSASRIYGSGQCSGSAVSQEVDRGAHALRAFPGEKLSASWIRILYLYLYLYPVSGHTAN